MKISFDNIPKHEIKKTNLRTFDDFARTMPQMSKKDLYNNITHHNFTIILLVIKTTTKIWLNHPQKEFFG